MTLPFKSLIIPSLISLRVTLLSEFESNFLWVSKIVSLSWQQLNPIIKPIHIRTFMIVINIFIIYQNYLNLRKSMQGQKFQQLLTKIDSAKFERRNKQKQWKEASDIIKQLESFQNDCFNQIDQATKKLQNSMQPQPNKRFDAACQSQWKIRANKVKKNLDARKYKLFAKVNQQQQKIQVINKLKNIFLDSQKTKHNKNIAKLEDQLIYIKNLQHQTTIQNQLRDQAISKGLNEKIRELDQILKQQENDLWKIDELENSLIKECCDAEQYMIQQLCEKIKKGEKKQNLLFRKAEAMISDIEID